MNEKIWWYVSRSSGVVALVLLTLSLVWGVLLATRVLKPLDRPAWLLDLHRWFGGMALVMTALHLGGLVLDGYVEFGAAEILVPFASEWQPLAVTVGVVSLYLLLAVQVSSYLMRWLPRRVWHGIHLASYLLVWTSAVHAGMAGTDVSNRLYQALALFLTLGAVAATVVRLLAPGRTRASRSTATPTA